MFTAYLRDIADRKRSEGHLHFLADHDPLTGLVNRRRFEEELRRQIANAERYTFGGALLIMDLDDFKQINDTLGHSAGDAVIKNVAGLLQRRLRKGTPSEASVAMSSQCCCQAPASKRRTQS